MSRTYDLIKEVSKNLDLANSIRIPDLVLILKEANDKYYNTDEPIFDDSVYDELLEILKKRSPKNHFLKKVGAPNKNKVELPFPMASLDKIKPDLNIDVYNRWVSKYKGPYYISDKLDGVSALIYVKGGAISMFTRGDGLHGQDISYLVPKIILSNTNTNSSVIRTLNSISANPDDAISIRGELIMSKHNFDVVNKNNEYKNARNTVSGLVNSKHYSEQLASLTEFIAYSVVFPVMKYSDQIKLIKKTKINIVNHSAQKDIDIPNLEDYFKARRALSQYEIDGIVVMDNSSIHTPPSSKSVQNPDYGFAFKMKLDEQSAITTVVSVEWECSKHGYVKPRVKLCPIELVGVTITFATAFNAKYVKDNKLGPGAVIEIARSGDVIPDIQRVITPSKASFPKFGYTWNESGVDIIADPSDPKCGRIISIKKITSFFQTIKVKNLSEGIITKLYDSGYDSIIKVLSVKNKSDLYDINGLGERIVDKIYQTINRCMDVVTIDKLMAGSTIFGRGLGAKKFKLIFTKYNFDDIMGLKSKPTIDMIVAVNGFDTLTAQQFISGLPKFKEFYKKLTKIYSLDHLQKTKSVPKSSIFKDKKIVLTGTRDDQVEDFIENSGGTITSSVSKNTSLVIYTDTNTTKFTKAISLNVPTIELDAFKKKYIT